ncbi:MAG: NAD kinase [Porphyromonadaceae bacterium]|nr:NAD kinase [Porphyromonadaceae bacterium]
MKIAIFGKRYLSGKKEEISTVFAAMQQRPFELLLDHSFCQGLQEAGIPLPKGEIFTGEGFSADLVLSLGGDGSFLHTAEHIGNRGIPILGINLGRMGFLADVRCRETDEVLSEILEGRYHIEERSLLHISEGYHTGWPYALNEIAVLKLDTSAMITIHAYVNGNYLNTYQADGLMVATPTGSTGYSLSVGGPIVDPQAANFVITPVAPHSLNVRPLVIGDNAEIKLMVESRNRHFLVSLDGRSEEKNTGEEIILRKAPFTTRIIKRNHHLFFDTLRKKLLWGADPRTPV